MYLTKAYEQVLNRFGADAQKQKSIEELLELKEAIELDDRQKVVEEISDVMNMIESLKIIYDISDYNIRCQMQMKMERTLNRYCPICGVKD